MKASLPVQAIASAEKRESAEDWGQAGPVTLGRTLQLVAVR